MERGSQAYRQQRVDPLDWPLLGVKVKGKIYFDLCPSFGCRSSAAAQQRVATALTYLMRKKYGYDMLAYVDDFIGFHKSEEQAKDCMNKFMDLCAYLGVQLAPEKLVHPTKALEWLGIQVDTIMMTLTIPKSKLNEVLQECTRWRDSTEASKKDLQKLIGKLAFISQCIPPARRFMARLLATLRAAPQAGNMLLDEEYKKDIEWFMRYAASAKVGD